MGLHDDDFHDEEEYEDEDSYDDDYNDEDSSYDDDDDDYDDDDYDDEDEDEDLDDVKANPSAQREESFDFGIDDDLESQPVKSTQKSENRAEIDLEDIKRLARSASPDLGEAMVAFLAQPDPQPSGQPPEGALTLSKVQSTIWSLRWRGKSERKKIAQETWSRFLKQPDWPPPPRFALADLMVELYRQGTEAGRAALFTVFQKAPLQFGVWGAFKRIYKLAEARLDAEMFGLLAWRFDTEIMRYGRHNVSIGTLIYLRRRAWRFLRQLGVQLPELYPQFAVQVLRHYAPSTRFSGSWVANHIFAHETKPRCYTGKSFPYNYPPQDLVKNRAFDEAWKRSPEPLMLLLETCQADPPARFAIQSLRRDFPETLRNVTPAWLDRLARRPLGSAHEFLVETLQGSPEFHQGKLKEKGLHETVLCLLTSPSGKARSYAIEYARAHAQDMENERLALLVETAPKDSKAFAAELLSRRDPRKLGYAFLGRLLASGETQKWAQKCLNESFDRKEIPVSFLVDMIYGANSQRDWAVSYLKSKYQEGEIKADFWRSVVDDPRRKQGGNAYYALRLATEYLGKFKVSEIGVGWLLDALEENDLQWQVSRWLKKADALSAEEIERLKGLVFSNKHRDLALELLGKTKLVKPRELGLSWLLALARRADPKLHEFAHRYLLAHLKPSDFSEKDDKEEGIGKLFSLATGEKEPEPVRLFAQTYLRCHHPGISAEQPETKSFGLKPQLPRSAYTAERVWGALFDSRPDVRKFAVAITRAELRSWGYQEKVYELAESDAKEVRNIAYDATLKAGEPNADPACTLTPEELDPVKIFSFTESRKRSTREVGMELIRKHYTRLGGPERLAWLMQSPDREVRLFAVRILWERHRPLSLSQGWKPRGKHVTTVEHAGRFADADALRGFLRGILYGVPPGRSADPRDDGAGLRRLSASVAKRNVIEIVRDMGLKDPAFARLVEPVLEEFTGALPKGEWQACLTALMQLRRAHKDL